MMVPDGSQDRPEWGGSTSRGLLADAQQNRPEAWTRLVHLYAPLVAAWCRRGGVAEQDVSDVLQDVFAAVARGLIRFHKEGVQDTFRGWLATVTRNKVRDYFRRRTSQAVAVGGTEATLQLTQTPDPRDAPVACDDTEPDVFGAVLQCALASIQQEFQPQTWRAFWCVVIEGRRAVDVAAELAMQPGAVRVCKSRVLARLRRELGDRPE